MSPAKPSCKFAIRTHKGRPQFSIPKRVQDKLNLWKFGGWVKLTVDSRTGHFEGIKRMMSGPEIYGKDINEAGIKKNQPIFVVASQPDRNVGRKNGRNEAYINPSESEMDSATSTLIGGNRIWVEVNRIERDPKARKQCIQIFGTCCMACGFDFAKTYGEIGAGFTHVHHLKPLSTSKGKHKVDARRDLRPVCPNCHEMLHRKKPPYSIEELKARISR